MIFVTEPFLPPIEEYEYYLKKIWKRKRITNNGPLIKELEDEIQQKLDLKEILLVNNGTMALQLAVKALNLKGEIITTPFSYVATTSSIVWENCNPVFVDIKKDTFNIDEKLIEAAITPNTSAILATHVFGNPCNIDRIEDIAKKHGLKTIYDAAHCFGSTYHGHSVLNYGNISTISFHGTKVFHTIEGGAIICKSENLKRKLSRMRNFGHDGPGKFTGIGINGKNSEFHAAMGLVNLKYIDSILAKRKLQHEWYDNLLSKTHLIKQSIEEKGLSNYSYYPILLKDEQELLTIMKALEEKGIHARRYFYPSLSELEYVETTPTPISSNISKRILCLPLYFDLTQKQIDQVCNIIVKTIS